MSFNAVLESNCCEHNRRLMLFWKEIVVNITGDPQMQLGGLGEKVNFSV
jgi:hypothetical protein